MDKLVPVECDVGSVLQRHDSAAGFTTGTVITHNTVSNTPWSAVAIGWGWGLLDSPSSPGVPTAVPGMWGNYSTPTIQGSNQITSNKFQNFAQQLWDVGAIYTNGSQGTDYAHGLMIKLNVAQNKRPAAGSNIYYTDGGSQYVTLEQSVSINDPVGTVDYGPCGYPDVPNWILLQAGTQGVTGPAWLQP